MSENHFMLKYAVINHEIHYDVLFARTKHIYQ